MQTLLTKFLMSRHWLKFVFKVASIVTDACWQANDPLALLSISQVLLKLVSDRYEMLSKFVSVLNSALVHMLLHNRPDGIVNRV